MSKAKRRMNRLRTTVYAVCNANQGWKDYRQKSDAHTEKRTMDHSQRCSGIIRKSA